MAKLDIDALTPEVMHELEVSIAGFFDRWRDAVIASLEAVNNLNKMVAAFEREDREMLQRWENEGGALCLTTSMDIGGS